MTASENFVAITTRGHYLVDQLNQATSTIVIGFHGYAENAADQMTRLQQLATDDSLALCAVQGLHLFYNRRGDVVASWMTSFDREQMIATNVQYIDAIVERLQDGANQQADIVLCGFSQGVAMAYRAACLGRTECSAVIAVGGDVPPDLDDEQLRTLPATVVARGNNDDVYPLQQHTTDIARLRSSRIDIHEVVFDGAHEWNEALNEQLRKFLRRDQ